MKSERKILELIIADVRIDAAVREKARAKLESMDNEQENA